MDIAAIPKTDIRQPLMGLREYAHGVPKIASGPGPFKHAAGKVRFSNAVGERQL